MAFTAVNNNVHVLYCGVSVGFRVRRADNAETFSSASESALQYYIYGFRAAGGRVGHSVRYKNYKNTTHNICLVYCSYILGRRPGKKTCAK